MTFKRVQIDRAKEAKRMSRNMNAKLDSYAFANKKRYVRNVKHKSKFLEYAD